MQTYTLHIDREAMAGTLLGKAFILGYNENRNFRVIVNLKPDRPVNDGEDQRHNPDEHIWKLEDLVMELKAAVRQGDCSAWPETPLTPFEKAVLPFVKFEREPEKGGCVRRSDGCYLLSWSALPIYNRGAFEAFKHAVDQLAGFERAVRELK